MNTTTCQSIGIGTLLLILATAAWLAAADAPPPPGPQGVAKGQAEGSVLLLRNGRLLQGEVSRTGDRFQVLIPGGEIQVKAAEVLCECRNVEEAYARRRATIQLDSAQEHLDLAAWCLRAGLLDAARAELAEAANLEPQHPLLPLMERRVQMASAPAENRDLSGKPITPGPSTQELDRMVRAMPPKTVEFFAQRIQPMLVNHCATSGCHSQGSSHSFQLLRIQGNSPPSPRLTQRNLYATLQWLNREDPGASPILKTPSGPHGTARAPVFPNHQAQQYRQLAEWCYRVCQVPSPVMQASYEESLDDLPIGQALSQSGRGPSRSHRTYGRRTNPGQAEPGPLDSAPERIVPWQSSLGTSLGAGQDSAREDVQGTRQNRAVKRGIAPKSPQSDPFDPAAFNRQFAPPQQNGAQPSGPGADQPTPQFDPPAQPRPRGSGQP